MLRPIARWMTRDVPGRGVERTVGPEVAGINGHQWGGTLMPYLSGLELRRSSETILAAVSLFQLITCLHTRYTLLK